jgi:phospholipid N-methyltransferase
MPSTSSPVAEGFWFLRKFLRAPGHVASFWPSSRWLARAMVHDLALRDGHAVVEFGPGTGPFTVAIDQRLGRGPYGYLGIERDADFADLLRRRFRNREICTADVADLGQVLAARPHLRPGAFVCGLPLVSMPVPVVDALLRDVASRLPEGGVFRTFSYVHTMVNPASWALRRRMRATFRHFAVRGPVWRNLPPALVFEGRM